MNNPEQNRHCRTSALSPVVHIKRKGANLTLCGKIITQNWYHNFRISVLSKGKYCKSCYLSFQAETAKWEVPKKKTLPAPLKNVWVDVGKEMPRTYRVVFTVGSWEDYNETIEKIRELASVDKEEVLVKK